MVATYGQTSWLGATATHSNDNTLGPALVALCNVYQLLEVIVNIHNGIQPAPELYPSRRIELTYIHGMKGLFWKRILTPERVRQHNVIWLFDSDVAVHPAALPLGLFASVLLRTNGSILQPSVRALGTKVPTHHGWLVQRHTHSSCVVTTAKFVELMTPFFQLHSWLAFYRVVLMQLPDHQLASSAYGLDMVWCAAMTSSFPKQPSCLVTPGDAITHRSTKTVKRYLERPSTNSSRVDPAAGARNNLVTLQMLFPQWFKSTNHDTKACWMINGNGKLVHNPAGGHWYDPKSGIVRAVTWARRGRTTA